MFKSYKLKRFKAIDIQGKSVSELYQEFRKLDEFIVDNSFMSVYRDILERETTLRVKRQLIEELKNEH